MIHSLKDSYAYSGLHGTLLTLIRSEKINKHRAMALEIIYRGIVVSVQSFRGSIKQGNILLIFINHS